VAKPAVVPADPVEHEGRATSGEQRDTQKNEASTAESSVSPSVEPKYREPKVRLTFYQQLSQRKVMLLPEEERSRNVRRVAVSTEGAGNARTTERSPILPIQAPVSVGMHTGSSSVSAVPIARSDKSVVSSPSFVVARAAREVSPPSFVVTRATGEVSPPSFVVTRAARAVSPPPVANGRQEDMRGPAMVNVGVFDGFELAARRASTLQRQGAPAHVIPVDTARGNRFMVRMGPFHTHDAARSALHRWGIANAHVVPFSS
jgi:cell division protein FtsN